MPFKQSMESSRFVREHHAPLLEALRQWNSTLVPPKYSSMRRVPHERNHDVGAAPQSALETALESGRTTCWSHAPNTGPPLIRSMGKYRDELRGSVAYRTGLRLFYGTYPIFRHNIITAS
jgi:hypothetical protein